MNVSLRESLRHGKLKFAHSTARKSLRAVTSVQRIALRSLYRTLTLAIRPFSEWLSSACVLLTVRFGGADRLQTWSQDSYLVDPASSHMLVSKIKPCMSKYKQFIL